MSTGETQRYNNHNTSYAVLGSFEYEAMSNFVGQAIANPESAEIFGEGRAIEVCHLDYRCYDELDPGHYVELSKRSYHIEPFAIAVRACADTAINGRFTRYSESDATPRFIDFSLTAEVTIPSLLPINKSLAPILGREFKVGKMHLTNDGLWLSQRIEDREKLRATIPLTTEMSGWEEITIPKQRYQPERTELRCADCK